MPTWTHGTIGPLTGGINFTCSVVWTAVTVPFEPVIVVPLRLLRNASTEALASCEADQRW